MLKQLERKLRLETNPVIFFLSAGFIFAFVAVAALFDKTLAAFFGAITTFIATYLGWFYILVVSCLLVFLVWLGLSHHGSVRLGSDDAKPEYSNAAWFTMLFAAGIGTILMFWGVAEPISHFGKPPMDGIKPQSVEAAAQAMDITLYHFGLHTWTIFAMPGLAIAYFVYRHNLPLRVSSIFYGVLGERVHGPIGWTIDTIAVVGTMFGVATSLGLGTLQVNSGINHLFGVPNGALAQFGIIAVITAIATTSVVLGLDKGIRRLSELNILLAVMLMAFIFIAGPTLFIMQSMVQTIGSYLSDLPRLAFWNDAYSDTGWQQDWTVFYWAWTISWAPFVGIFIARISKRPDDPGIRHRGSAAADGVFAHLVYGVRHLGHGHRAQRRGRPRVPGKQGSGGGVVRFPGTFSVRSRYFIHWRSHRRDLFYHFIGLGIAGHRHVELGWQPQPAYTTARVLGSLGRRRRCRIVAGGRFRGIAERDNDARFSVLPAIGVHGRRHVPGPARRAARPVAGGPRPLQVTFTKRPTTSIGELIHVSKNPPAGGSRRGRVVAPVLAGGDRSSQGGGGSLYLLSILPDMTLGFYPSVPEPSPSEVYKEAGRRLEALAAEHVPDDIARETLISRGSVYRNIIRKAREINTDLIVMTAHNPNIQDILLGSNTSQVVHHAHCAVLVVRAS